MSMFRAAVAMLFTAPILAACAGMPEEGQQADTDKGTVVVGSRIPTKIVPSDVSTGSDSAIDKTRKNSEISRQK